MADTQTLQEETLIPLDNDNKCLSIELKRFNENHNEDYDIEIVTQNSTSLLDSDDLHTIRNQVATESHFTSNPFIYLLNLLQSNYAILFLLFLCGLPLLIKLAPVHSHVNFNSNESAQLLRQDDTLSTKQSTLGPSTTTLTLFTSVILRTLVSTQPAIDVLLVNILQRLRDDRLRKTLTRDSFRLKSLCSNSYVSVRKGSIHARLSEDKAFDSKYSEIESLRLGNYVALRNDFLNMFICYDTDGNLRPTRQEQLNELCIFKQRIFIEFNSVYREFVLVPKLFSNEVSLQFRSDGAELKAQQSISHDVNMLKTNTLGAKRIVDNRFACPHLTGLLIHKTKLDIGLKSIENSIRKRAQDKFNSRFIVTGQLTLTTTATAKLKKNYESS